MKRDMELCRKILFAVEESNELTGITNLQVNGYSKNEVAYHCQLLEEAGLLANYHPQYGDDEVYFFSVGTLTWEGHDFLDRIREDTVWNKTKEVITQKRLPMMLNVIGTISSAVITAMTEGAIKAIIEKGGV